MLNYHSYAPSRVIDTYILVMGLSQLSFDQFNMVSCDLTNIAHLVERLAECDGAATNGDEFLHSGNDFLQTISGTCNYILHLLVILAC